VGQKVRPIIALNCAVSQDSFCDSTSFGLLGVIAEIV
jgi:hypothetical protein